jgi:hypothetical protein
VVAAAAAVESGEGVFPAAIVATGSYVAFPIARLVSVEVVELLFSAARHWSIVTVMRVEAVIDVAEKAGMAVKPRTSAKKHPAYKPVGPIVAIGRTVIWGIVEVPVRANGSHSNADGDLGWPQRCTT